MSVKRVMGTETEYAVSQPGVAYYQPVQLSFDVVKAASDPSTAHIRWDYRQEDPVNDARGTRLDRAAARPDMLTDEPQLNITNVIAPNGGRIYVDHAHPEYSAPETRDPFEAVAYDHAGDRLMLAAAQAASAAAERPIVLHRNNVDGKGASWGTHENYMMSRSVPFEKVSRLMTLHFVSRQIYAGSGRVGLGERGETPGYQISQRADYIQSKIGLQTTFDRPIINTRDEPHGPAASRRLHVIVGDANRMEVPQALKLGVTSMLLWLLEHAEETGFELDALLDELALADPVAALHTVSRDLSLAAELPLESGETTTAWIIQVRLRMAVYQAAAVAYGIDTAGEPAWPDRATRSVMAMWGQALADTAAIRHADDDARLAMSGEASRVEWLLKWQLLEKLRRKIEATATPTTEVPAAQASSTSGVSMPGGSGIGSTDTVPASDIAPGQRAASGWDDPRIAAIDLKWAALDPADSVFERLRARTERVLTDGEVARAAAEPPEDTRAWLRAMMVRRYPGQMAAASWSHLTARDENTASAGETYGNASRAPRPASDLFSLDTADPEAFTRADCEPVMEQCEQAVQVLRRLAETRASTV
ncbi:proteasome accessory factor PafA2 [Bifidobacterium lemurum]|uniref:Proteasome accessory factor PafA2 n=1 Tax=Bifidobacterium lemurum TaxID=1603886 RepID=A0A261FT01_9BIFI|nr:depupylase/deamidase Dop [Bifidobacterium lemurum]OZG62279.1 proteasome accessory factor PafA2 [Bifidobacterium lemurum]QOL33646.1 proteasome accessory factor PafA2 [Bifidobacterium lemurum]